MKVILINRTKAIKKLEGVKYLLARKMITDTERVLNGVFLYYRANETELLSRTKKQFKQMMELYSLRYGDELVLTLLEIFDVELFLDMALEDRNKELYYWVLDEKEYYEMKGYMSDEI